MAYFYVSCATPTVCQISILCYIDFTIFTSCWECVKCTIFKDIINIRRKLISRNLAIIT
nr:MAG TPA: hypothetical protein [Caudoviricetes sp.]